MTTTTVAVACAIKTEVECNGSIRRYNREYYERNERICLFVCSTMNDQLLWQILKL